MAATEPRRNVELKARAADPDRLRRIANDLGARAAGVENQRDTYFHAPFGRLKLREIEGQPAVLIAYARADASHSRRSDYRLAPISDPELTKEALASSLGIRSVVEKRREIYLFRKVRIHLDDVAGQGTFLEFEAVLEPDQPEAEGHALLAELQSRFGIRDEDLIEGSYGDG